MKKYIFPVLSMCLFMLIPLIVHFPIFSSDSSFIHFTTSISGSASDMTGAIRLPQFLDHMNASMLTTWVNYPLGEGILNWQQITQLLQMVVLYLASLFFSPANSVAVLVSIGSALSAGSVYLLTRTIGGQRPYALMSGLLFFTLPIWNVGIGSFTSAAFMGLPLGVLALFLRAIELPVLKNCLIAYLSMIVVLLTDGYWMYVSILMVFTLMIITLLRVYVLKPIEKSKLMRFSLATIIGIVAFLITSVFMITQRQNLASDISRPLNGSSVETVNLHGGLISNFITPSDGHFLERFFLLTNGTAPYFGLTVILGSVYLLLRGSRLSKFHFEVFVVFSVSISVSLKAYLENPFGPIPNLSVVTGTLFPGFTYNHRTSWVASAMLLSIFMGLFSVRVQAMELRKHRRTNRISAQLFLLAVTSVLAFDLSPADARYLSTGQTQLTGIRAELSKSQSKAFVALPSTINGRGWLYQAYLDAPMVNGLRTTESIAEYEKASELGQYYLSKLLVRNEINELLVVERGGKAVLIENSERLLIEKIDPRYFTKVEEAEVEGIGSDKIVLVLYRTK